MAYEFKLPDLGEGVVEGEIVRWLIKPGDFLTEDQPMVEIMTDKATVEIPSPRRGRVAATQGNAGEVVKVGATLVVIEEESGVSVPLTAERPHEEAAAAPVASMPVPAPPPVAIPQAAPAVSAARPLPVAPARKPGERALASPSTRKLARELSMNIEIIAGTGSHGRVIDWMPVCRRNPRPRREPSSSTRR